MSFIKLKLWRFDDEIIGFVWNMSPIVRDFLSKNKDVFEASNKYRITMVCETDSESPHFDRSNFCLGSMTHNNIFKYKLYLISQDSKVVCLQLKLAIEELNEAIEKTTESKEEKKTSSCEKVF